MKNKTAGKILSLYSLVQVGKLEDELKEARIKEGYSLNDFVQVEGTFEDEEVPHKQFATYIYNSGIRQSMFEYNDDTIAAIDEGLEVNMTQSDWVETISEDGHKAFDTAVVVTATSSNGKQWDICTAFFRVEVRNLEV